MDYTDRLTEEMRMLAVSIIVAALNLLAFFGSVSLLGLFFGGGQ